MAKHYAKEASRLVGDGTALEDRAERILGFLKKNTERWCA